MSAIQEFLQKLIQRQISDFGIVVWYDPEGFYCNLIDQLTFPGVNIFCYKDSFFALRVKIESFLNQPECPKLLVYVPLEQDQTLHALIEVEAAGVIVKPGAVPQACNTRPAFIARQALQPLLGETAAQAIEKQVEEGKLSLVDLEKLADQGGGLSKGVVSLIYATGSPQDVALAFLSSDEHDEELIAKEAIPELAALLQTVYEYHPASQLKPAEYRKALTRFILISELLYRLPAPLPEVLTTVPAAVRPAAREDCAMLANIWRNRRDICESYLIPATQVEMDLHLKELPLTLEQLKSVETFLDLEKRLAVVMTNEIIENTQESMVVFAEKRQSTFWPEQRSELQAQWALIASAGRVLLQAQRIEKTLKTLPNIDSVELAKLYTETDKPLCLLDTYHRNMERRIHNFDFDATGIHQLLEQLIAQAREKYMQAGNLLAKRFVSAYSANKFLLPGLLPQREIFNEQLKSNLLGGKIAFVWVDALRFEMGRELAETLAGEFDVAVQPAVASVPTITEIGMASLLPLPKEPPMLYSPAEGKLALQVEDIPIRDRKDRIAYLSRQTYLKTTDLRLDELLPSPKKSIRDAIKAADLVIVTSQEIDELCEGDNVHLARRIMDDMLLELRRVFRILRDLGVKTIICTADHGYLFGEDVGVDMKIDPPGGNSVDLHRRVWVGQGGAANDAYLRAPLAQFGWNTDLEIAVPWNFACFKVKGGTRAYFHGGLSPEELFIPVLTIKSSDQQSVEVGSYTWKLTPGTPKVSTRFFSVQIAGEVSSLFEAKTPKVRVEIRSGNDSLATAISASYGFTDATGDVQLRHLSEDPRKIEPNTVTLMITKEPAGKKLTVSIVLLDAETGVELSRLDEIEMAFAI
jgi:hypothetical protein